MKLPRDVLVDLVALYHSGEASEATRTFLEEQSRTDPALERLLIQPSDPDLAQGSPPPLTKEIEMATFEKARKKFRRQSWMLAIALALTFIPVSMGLLTPALFLLGVTDGNDTGEIFLAVTLLSLIPAFVGWTVYFFLRREMNHQHG